LNVVGATTVWLFSVGILGAQVMGSLGGYVRDPVGAVVPGASLRVVEESTRAERRVVADSQGGYLVAGLAPGSYEIEVSQPGFRLQLRRGLALGAGRHLRLDFQLELGEAFDRVEVKAETPLISSDAGDWAASLDRQKLESLPLNGRDLFDLAGQQLGASVTTRSNRALHEGLGTPVSVNGGRSNQNSFRLDGVDINDATGSAPASAAGRLVGLEAIQELRLVTSPFRAEYGHTAGGVLIAVSKSGGNGFHGSLYDFLRNSALDAKDFFDPPEEEIPPLRKNQFGAFLGGPLRKDRLFVAANYEGIRERSGATLRPATITPEARQGRLPGPGGGRVMPVASVVEPYLRLYPLPNGRDFGDGAAELVTQVSIPTREDHASNRLDALFSPRVRLAARYVFDDAWTYTPDPFRIWELPSTSRHQFAHTDTQYVPSARSLHHFRAGFSRVRNTETGRAAEAFPATLAFVPGQVVGAIQVVGLGDLGPLRSRLQPRQYVVNTYQFGYESSRLRGRNAFQFGAGYNRVQYNQVADVNRGGFYRFDSLADFLQARPRVGELMAPGSDTTRGWRIHQVFAFAHHDVALRPGLSLAAGLRYETYSTPVEVNGKIATLRDPERDPSVVVGGPLFRNPSRKNLAPRLSLAWDVTGSGRTIMRAGSGVFFDLLGTRELVIAGVRMPPFYQRLSMSRPAFPNLLEAARASLPQLALDTLDFHLQQPYVLHFQFLVERQLTAMTVLRLGYAGARGIHLPGFLGNVNPTRPSILPDGRLFFPPDTPRLNPAFEAIRIRRTLFNSFYHALQAEWQRRLRGGLGVQAKYAWSKSIDETSSAIFMEYVTPDRVPTMFNFRQNRGLSDFDARHTAALNFSCELPVRFGPGMRRWSGGWEIHSHWQLHSGHPFSPEVGFDRARLRGSENLGQRPDYVPRPGAPVILGDPHRYFDPLAFALPPAGVYGNLGRNALPGPGAVTLNAALHKLLWKRERHSLRARWEVFNVTNRPNWQIPADLALFSSDLTRVGSAGRITSTSTPARQMQLALKWTF